MRSLSSLAPLAAVALLAGCSYTEDVPARNNGESKVLSFEGPTGVAPLGAPRSVIVGRDTGGTKDCTLGARSVTQTGGLHPTGGSLNGPDHCGPVKTEASAYSVESAACDDDACTVTPDAAGSQWLHVAATAAQVAAGAPVTARLRVTLKNKADGALFNDSYVVRFARAARIELHTGTDSPLPLVTPLMPGVEMRLPTASVVDENGRALEVESGTLVQTLDGDSFVPASDSAYNRAYLATRPGHAKLTWELAGVLTRSLDLEVVDAATARSLAILAPPNQKDRRGTKQDVDDALAVAEAPAVDSLSDTAGRPISADVRVLLADGRAALVNIERVETDRATEADTFARDYEFDVYRLGKAGVAGSVTVSAAGLSRSLPFTLAP